MKLPDLRIHSVCDSMHWKLLLSSPDPKVREDGVEALKVALEDANIFGADAVLLVPGRVTDTVSYDDCWNRSTEEIKKAIPFAEKLKVKIAVENVWNNFLLSPWKQQDILISSRVHGLVPISIAAIFLPMDGPSNG